MAELRAVIYARFSSSGQREESIEGQVRDCIAYAERNGYTIIGTYTDRAISGMTDNRPDFQRMIDDSKKKLFNIVLVWKTDRFARKREDSILYKGILKQNGVRVVSVMEKFSDDPIGLLMEGIMEDFAEYYSIQCHNNIILN